MTIYDLTEYERDIPDTRTYALDNGNEAVFSRDGNPFGYWTVRFKTGGLPKELDGMFTSYESAITAFQVYLAKKNEKRYTQVNMKEEPSVKGKTNKKPKKSAELFDKD